MELKIKISNPDYNSLFKAALPILGEKLKKSNSIGYKLLSRILNMPGDIPLKMLSVIPDDKKEELLTELLNHNSEKIIEWIEKALLEKGFDINIESFELTNN